MRLSHACRAISVRFDDPNLVSCVGLVPVMALAARCGLRSLLAEMLTLTGKGTANAAAKITAVIGGLVAGADSITDLDLLRHGGMSRVFTEVRAPSTVGTFLRRFTFGHVRQLDAVAARLLARLAAATPLLAGAEQVTYLDLDDTVRQTYGYAKQGAGRGYTGVKGLNALLAVLSTPITAPVIAATRLRKGSTNSARGAPRLLTEALATARRVGAGTARHGMLLVRADSAYYGHDIIAACCRAGARFSVTARLIVRRVRRLNPRTVTSGQSEMFAVYRYHAVFTDNPEPMLVAEATHRDHAIVEQVIAELTNTPAGPPALGGVHRERRLAGLRRDLPQPHPRRRRPGRRPPHP